MKTILTIAGSDSGGCAGIQADIKTAQAFDCYSTTCLTVLTAQNTTGVKEIFPISPQFIQSQLNAIFNDIEIHAIKIGMLYHKDVILAVYEILKDIQIPIVVDPVCISRSGDKLLLADAIEEYKKLFSIATIVTPNFYEACYILNNSNQDVSKLVQNANDFVSQYKTYLLIKQFPQNQYNTIDTLFCTSFVSEFNTPTVDTKNNNGTGCSFSTAIACGLAKGQDLTIAINNAKSFIYQALLKAPNIGKGNGPINHKAGGI